MTQDEKIELIGDFLRELVSDMTNQELIDMIYDSTDQALNEFKDHFI